MVEEPLPQPLAVRAIARTIDVLPDELLVALNKVVARGAEMARDLDGEQEQPEEFSGRGDGDRLVTDADVLGRPGGRDHGDGASCLVEAGRQQRRESLTAAVGHPPAAHQGELHVSDEDLAAAARCAGAVRRANWA